MTTPDEQRSAEIEQHRKENRIVNLAYRCWAEDPAMLELLGRRVVAALTGDLPVPPGGYELCGEWLAQEWFTGKHPTRYPTGDELVT